MEKSALGVVLLLTLAACASGPGTKTSSLGEPIAEIDTAYRQLPASLPRYNQGIRDLCQEFAARPTEFAAALRRYGVSVEWPKVRLPLHQIHVLDASERSDKAGVPLILEYDTARTPHHPPEGLFVDATAVYNRDAGRPRLRFRTAGNSLKTAAREFPIASNPTAAANHLKARARRFAGSGFMSMLRPASMERSPRIYLLDPYDPQKTPLLMVHGLQSTPVAFASLVSALRSDPEIRARYQIWQFYYASGTPVLANAASLRHSLANTLAQFDPQSCHPATRDIVVVGHSMGGVISHTLVSDSHDRLWASVFRVPPERLKGDRETIRSLDQILRFKRNPAVQRVVFMAAPHRGSPVADSFVGHLGHTLARMPAMQESGFSALAEENPHQMMPGAAEFYAGGRFSAVRTLSRKSTALIALSSLPIAVPHHSVIGQQQPGSKESGSDGVVPYRSSHLDSAASEVIVRSGHGVINNPAAIAEVIRILRLHARRSGS